MYYLERLMEWFQDLGWKRKALLAGGVGLLFGLGSTVAGPLLSGVVLGLFIVDFITDDVLDLHE
jgi:hypothetical protein